MGCKSVDACGWLRDQWWHIVRGLSHAVMFMQACLQSRTEPVYPEGRWHAQGAIRTFILRRSVMLMVPSPLAATRQLSFSCTSCKV